MRNVVRWCGIMSVHPERPERNRGGKMNEKCCEMAWDHVSAFREGYIETEEVWCGALMRNVVR
jgi:hypothetical protein